MSVRQLQPPGTHLLVWGEGEKPSGGCYSHAGELGPQKELGWHQTERKPCTPERRLVLSQRRKTSI